MPDPLRSDTAVSTFAFTEDKTNTLWTSHDKTHAIERTAVETALEAAGSQNALLKEYLKTYIESELRTYSSKLDVLRTRLDAVVTARQVDKQAAGLILQLGKQGVDEERTQWREGHAREHALAQLAIDKAEGALAIRLEGLNEARARANDERGSLATKTQLDDKLEAVQARIGILERAGASITGRDAGISAVGAASVAFAGVVIGIVSIVLHFVK